MKPISRNLLLLAMAWTLGLVSAQNPQRWSRELPTTHPNVQEVYERLHKIIVPCVDYVGASVTDVMNSVLELPRDGGKGVGTIVAVKGNEPTITLHGKAMRFLDVIDNICKQAGLFWWIESTHLVISSKEAYERSAAPATRK